MLPFCAEIFRRQSFVIEAGNSGKKVAPSGGIQRLLECPADVKGASDSKMSAAVTATPYVDKLYDIRITKLIV